MVLLTSLHLWAGKIIKLRLRFLFFAHGALELRREYDDGHIIRIWLSRPVFQAPLWVHRSARLLRQTPSSARRSASATPKPPATALPTSAAAGLRLRGQRRRGSTGWVGSRMVHPR